MPIKSTHDVLVVNLFGGPSCGKSTIAAQLYVLLKVQGVTCEYVAEYAKRKTWERSFHLLNDQLYVSAKQHHEILMAAQDCEVIITDSPVLLGLAYSSQRDFVANLPATLRRYAKQFKNFNVFLERGSFAYEEQGRSQSHVEALGKDAEIKRILAQYQTTEEHPWHHESGISATVQNNRHPMEVAQEILARLQEYKAI
jgi:hypothetical protein